jgi:hypothetical protein
MESGADRLSDVSVEYTAALVCTTFMLMGVLQLHSSIQTNRHLSTRAKNINIRQAVAIMYF